MQNTINQVNNQQAQNTQPQQSAQYLSNQTNEVQTNNQTLYKKIGLVIFALIILGLLTYMGYQKKMEFNSAQIKNGATISKPVIVKTNKNELPKTPTKLPTINNQLDNKISQTAKLIATSLKNQYQVGETITIELTATLPGQPDAIEFVLKYDPKLLTDVKFTKGSAFSTYIKENIYPEKGALKVMIVKNPGETIQIGKTKQVSLGTLTAQVAQPGTLNVFFDEQKSVIAANGGENILQTTKSTTIKLN